LLRGLLELLVTPVYLPARTKKERKTNHQKTGVLGAPVAEPVEFRYIAKIPRFLNRQTLGTPFE
jgi:hypothetical protein